MTQMTPEQAQKYLKRYADEDIPDRIAHRALETLAYRDADPAHIHAAVAEIVRLRQAIARLRDYYIHMDYGIAADDLTRILNGEA